MKALWAWGVRQRLAKSNPWADTRAYAVKTEGFRPWTEADVDAFTTCYPVGTKEHLAMALMLGTFARRSDAIRLGPQHARNGRLKFRSRKTGAELDLPISSDLGDALAAHKTETLCYLVTAFGRPFTDAGFGNWFADRCKAAGIPGRAHGLRKLAAIRMAHAGATLPELMAWGGWTSEREPMRYIQQANKARLADAGADKLSSARGKLDNSQHNTLKGNEKQ